ncbi:MAG TPA: NAD(P)-dependent oxidoreductase, partial [Dysgonamonadaceae bacterium]|nr:NAD(P)-dependent oxidoreductase [Dysgonamonadaceae bacterium]
MNILVTFKTFGNQKDYLKNSFKESATVFFAEDYREEDLENVFAKSDILLSWNPSAEGIDKNRVPLSNIKFMQLMSAGYDHVRLEDFPEGFPIACNKGAYAEPMAEHVVAMMLALSKRLTVYHADMSNGHFKQMESQTKFIKGTTVGIVGFGAIGKAVARLL